MPMSIVKDFRVLKKIVKKEKGAGKKVVLTQGSWDLVHIGHARYLKRAKQHGDYLIVGIDSDKKIKKRKGPDRPVVPQEERMEMLTHIEHVDLVVLKQDTHPRWHLIRTVEPDVLIAIDENYSAQELKELEKICGEVVILDRQATTSTSAKIRLLQIGLADKLAKALLPRIIETIETVFSEIKANK